MIGPVMRRSGEDPKEDPVESVRLYSKQSIDQILMIFDMLLTKSI